MAQQFWFYRYFIYLITKKNDKILKEIKQYSKNHNYTLTKNGKYYQSELFWEYKKGSHKINDFYDELLKNEVELVFLNDFKKSQVRTMTTK